MVTVITRSTYKNGNVINTKCYVTATTATYFTFKYHFNILGTDDGNDDDNDSYKENNYMIMMVMTMAVVMIKMVINMIITLMRIMI